MPKEKHDVVSGPPQQQEAPGLHFFPLDVADACQPIAQACYCQTSLCPRYVCYDGITMEAVDELLSLFLKGDHDRSATQSTRRTAGGSRPRRMLEQNLEILTPAERKQLWNHVKSYVESASYELHDVRAQIVNIVASGSASAGARPHDSSTSGVGLRRKDGPRGKRSATSAAPGPEQARTQQHESFSARVPPVVDMRLHTALDIVRARDGLEHALGIFFEELFEISSARTPKSCTYTSSRGSATFKPKKLGGYNGRRHRKCRGNYPRRAMNYSSPSQERRLATTELELMKRQDPEFETVCKSGAGTSTPAEEKSLAQVIKRQKKRRRRHFQKTGEHISGHFLDREYRRSKHKKTTSIGAVVASSSSTSTDSARLQGDLLQKPSSGPEHGRRPTEDDGGSDSGEGDELASSSSSSSNEENDVEDATRSPLMSSGPPITVEALLLRFYGRLKETAMWHQHTARRVVPCCNPGVLEALGYSEEDIRLVRDRAGQPAGRNTESSGSSSGGEESETHPDYQPSEATPFLGTGTAGDRCSWGKCTKFEPRYSFRGGQSRAMPSGMVPPPVFAHVRLRPNHACLLVLRPLYLCQYLRPTRHRGRFFFSSGCEMLLLSRRPGKLFLGPLYQRRRRGAKGPGLLQV
ncbi:unnamed protein product [Amoebophrya sp. A120]|nr:unnamed protein product [Amoebophrya sp. A120]|eukprot:GSA120T00009352001.1